MDEPRLLGAGQVPADDRRAALDGAGAVGLLPDYGLVHPAHHGRPASALFLTKAATGGRGLTTCHTQSQWTVCTRPILSARITPRPSTPPDAARSQRAGPSWRRYIPAAHQSVRRCVQRAPSAPSRSHSTGKPSTRRDWSSSAEYARRLRIRRTA